MSEGNESSNVCLRVCMCSYVCVYVPTAMNALTDVYIPDASICSIQSTMKDIPKRYMHEIMSSTALVATL